MAGILACHVLVFLAVVLFRRNTTFLGIMFCVLGTCAGQQQEQKQQDTRQLPLC